MPSIRLHKSWSFRLTILYFGLFVFSALLLLALIGEGGYKVPAERLSDLLWPDSDGDQAAQNLKVALHRLRRLGCAPDEAPVNWIHVKHGHVSLARSLCWVDAHAGCN